jgi:uncharacterized protein YdaU (DUF1376 family)
MKTTTRLPWFPMIVSDWLLSPSIRFMTPEARGLYIQLLCEQWANGGALPDDDRKLKYYAGANDEQWQRSSPDVLTHFERTDGTIFNAKLRQLMEERGAWREKLSEAGKRGNEKRWGNSKTDDRSDTSELNTAIRGIFDYYVSATERNPRAYSLTDKRRKSGIARLKECLEKTSGDLGGAANLMRCAIDALVASDYHMARGKFEGQTKYNDWENLFRSQEQLEKWWNR